MATRGRKTVEVDAEPDLPIATEVEPDFETTDGVTEPDPTYTTLTSRLIAAQHEIGNVTKNATNPHFKNKFVDITQLLSTVLPALHKHGLFLTQRVDIHGGMPVLKTQIYDETGSSLPPSLYPIISKDSEDPQKFGAGVTYARRYALLAYLGIGTEDDDGTTAAKPRAATQPRPATQLSPELETLVGNLKAAGYTKETVAAALEQRFGRGVRKSVTALTPEEIKAWNDELTLEKGVAPF